MTINDQVNIIVPIANRTKVLASSFIDEDHKIKQIPIITEGIENNVVNIFLGKLSREYILQIANTTIYVQIAV